MDKKELNSLIENAKKIVKNIGSKKLRECANNIANDVIHDRASGCYIWYLDKYNDDGYDYALVMGATEGIDDYYDFYTNEDYSVSMKLARQSSNSCMQCDYDYDWEYPFYEDSGECIMYEEILTDDYFDNLIPNLEIDIENFFNDLYYYG